MLVISGLHAASTLPLAIPINNVEMNNDQKPVAIIVRIIPATWQKNAIEIILPIPIISTSGPPKTIATVKPQKAVPTIHPTCVWVRLNSVAQATTKEPLVAKASAVTTNATQLALNNRVFLTVSILVLLG
jgi:hypothetical protein